MSYKLRIRMTKHKDNSERITNIKPIIDHYNWDGINYPSSTNNFKKQGSN